jgi:thiol:disulfide interchange protein
MLSCHSFNRASVVVSWLTVAALPPCVGCEIREQAPAEVNRSAEADERDAGGGIDFIVGYERGCQAARQQQKPMMVFFTAQWCTYCRQMANEAF